VPNGALYLVTGADKTSSWGVASFRGAAPEGTAGLRFAVADAGYETQYVWEGSGPGSTLTGPKRSQDQGAAARQNQSVFIRGFRLCLNDVRFADVLSPSMTSNPSISPVGHPSDLTSAKAERGGEMAGMAMADTTEVDVSFTWIDVLTEISG